MILITPTQREVITSFIKNKDKKNKNHAIAMELGITINALRTRYHSLIKKGIMSGGTGEDLELTETVDYFVIPVRGSQASRKIKLARKSHKTEP